FMAGIALFVGAFLIYNALSMTVVERSRELALLRCVGMTRKQIMFQVIFEGFVLGVIGAALGIGAGILLSLGLTSFMSGILGQELERGSISYDILFSSMAIGILVTLISAFLPAYQAGKISPIAALQIRGGKEEGLLQKYGWLLGLLLLIISAGILVWNPFPYDVQFRLGSMTVFSLFLGATLTIPITLKAWQKVGRWPLRLLFGNIGEIGSRNLKRSEKRTMLTCAALMVGVSMIVSTQGITESFKVDLNQWIDAYMGADIYVGAQVPLTRQLQEKLESLPMVGVVTPVRSIEATWLKDGKEVKINFTAVEPQTYSAVTRFVFSDKDVVQEEALDKLKKGDHLFISEVMREKYGVEIADVITLKTKEGQRSFAVAAVVLDFSNQGLVVTGNISDLEKYYKIEDVNTFYVNAKDNVKISDAIEEIKQYQKEYQLVIESNSAIKERVEVLMGQVFSMFDILGILAVLVAALGVFNTLSMSVLERTREIGMLRTMGMTRGQVVKMILAEAGLLGLIGGLLGLGLGLLLTKILLAAMGAMSGYSLSFVLPEKAIWMSIVVALATSQLAALLPAIRGARTPMLSAIHYE
ncbi:MAG: FtsX-like permease family protein, partial [Tissierellia bacterium]|nr:FtsX-like permease family protein [Tissierellia bacterium]